MNYTVVFLRRAQKELGSLPITEYERVRDAIGGLATDPRPPGCKKLSGRDGWRIRIGDYRVIYDISNTELLITVVRAGHRLDIYR